MRVRVPAVRTNKDDAFEASASIGALLRAAQAAQAAQYDRIHPLAGLSLLNLPPGGNFKQKPVAN